MVNKMRVRRRQDAILAERTVWGRYTKVFRAEDFAVEEKRASEARKCGEGAVDLVQTCRPELTDQMAEADRRPWPVYV